MSAKKKYKKNTKTNKKHVVTKKTSNISSEELLNNILDKSKVRKEKRKNYNVVKKNNKNFQKYIRPNKKLVNTTNEELLDKIITKKKTQKKKKAVKKVVVEKKVLERPIEKKIEEPEIKEDLIITKEIQLPFDKIDINDEDVIAKIKDAVLEEEAKDETFIDRSSEQFEIEETLKIETSPKKEQSVFSKFGYLIPVFVLGVSIGTLFIYFLNYYNKSNISSVDDFREADVVKNIEIENEDNSEELERLYNECLQRPYSEIDNNEILQNAKAELDAYLSKYKTSVAYQDLTIGNYYSYNPSKVYYAASTMKSLAALYIYSKAAIGEVDLNSTIKYTSRYSWSESMEMKKHKYGEDISIRNLVNYAITVSDNSAYQMLVAYIGRQNLKNYGISLGAKYTLSGGDNFGSITVNDAIIYMKTLNDFINNNGELGEELKQVFLGALQNDIAIPEYNVAAAHKYGEYKPNYHDIGIVYDEKPYLIAVLTTEGYGDFEGKIKDISKHVYKYHNIFWENRKGICSSEINK